MGEKSGITYTRLCRHLGAAREGAKAPSGGPSGTLGEARDAGGKALPAPQAESD